MYIYLLVMTILLSFGMQGWLTIYNNFAVEAVNIDGQQMGLLQSVREIPGFLALLVVYLLLFFKEHRLAAFSLLLFGLGISITGFLDSFWGMILSITILSVGFHYYETLNQSLSLQYFTKIQAPLVISKLKSLGAITKIIASLFVLGAASFLSYKVVFLLLGLMVCVGAIYCLFQNPENVDLPKQHKKMVFRKRYWLFYVLNMLSGARRQIFTAFAAFLLVKKFNFTVQEIAILFGINNLITFFVMPYVGKLINKIGERAVLSIEYIGLMFVFATYALAESKLLVSSIYIIDHILFGFFIAINSYFQKNADPKDIAPSMAVSFTINHVIAIILPIVGGMLWMIDYKIPFILGVGISALSLFFVQFIREPKAEATLEAQEAL